MALVRCVNCGKEYSNTLKACPHCKYEVKMKICPECGSINSVKAVQCSKCGFDLEHNQGSLITSELMNEKYLLLCDKLNDVILPEEYDEIKEQFILFGDYKESQKKIKECNRGKLYIDLVNIPNENITIKELKDIKEKFESMGDYKDSKRKVSEYDDRYKEALYKETIKLEQNDVLNLEEQKKFYEELGNYKDSNERLKNCVKKIEEEQIKNRKKNKQTLLTVGLAAAIALVIVFIFTMVVPNMHYKKADQALNDGNYKVAIREFEKANKYKDSVDKLHYSKAKKAYDSKEYEDAYNEYKLAGKYADSEELADESYKALNYIKAKESYDQGTYEKALEYIQEAGDYKDSNELKKEISYNAAIVNLNVKNFMNAKNLFLQAEDYEDAEEFVKLSEAELYMAEGKLSEAVEMYLNIDFISDKFDVQARKKLVLGCSSIAKACGTWNATKNYLESKNVHISTGISDSWYIDTLLDNQSVVVTGTMHDDGTVTLKGTVTFYQFLNYSSLQENCQARWSTKDFEVQFISSMPPIIPINEGINLYYSDGVYTLKGALESQPYISFIEYYNTSVTYGEKVS